MKTLLTAAVLAAAFVIAPAAHATDLDVSYKSSNTGAPAQSFTFKDVKKGELPQITVAGPTGTPVRISLTVQQVDGGKVVADAKFFEIHTNLYGRENPELLLSQELDMRSGNSSATKVVIDDRGTQGTFEVQVSPRG